MSPYYPGYYATNSWCEWRITAPVGHLIRLEFVYFNLERGDIRCLKDYVEVLDGTSADSTSRGRFCGYNYPEMLESSSNNMLIVFKSDSKVVRTGFKAEYYTRKGRPEFCATRFIHVCKMWSARYLRHVTLASMCANIVMWQWSLRAGQNCKCARFTLPHKNHEKLIQKIMFFFLAFQR